MENNEIMNEGIETIIEEVGADNATGVGAGKAVAITVGLALAAFAGVKLIAKAYANHKAKKELRQPDKETIVEAEDVVDVATE